MTLTVAAVAAQTDGNQPAPTAASRPAASPGSGVERYGQAHARYRELYPALAPTFDRA